jgi:hypothetical protein
MVASGTPPQDLSRPTPGHAVETHPIDAADTHALPLRLQAVDLRNDPLAAVFVKDEVVDVVFAKSPGALLSLEGPNAYAVNDALVQAASGERWVVSRARFDPKYLPADAGLRHGDDGAYRNRPVPVLAKRMDRSFTIARSAGGDFLQGVAGDWLLQYAPEDYGVVQQARFARVYQARPEQGDRSSSVDAAGQASAREGDKDSELDA